METGTRTTAVLAALAALGAILLGACGPSAEEKPIRATFERFLEGLDRADSSVLWALADDQTHRFFDDLAKETADALVEVDAHWPEAERAATRRSIAGDYVTSTTTGATLFGAFLDARRLQAPKDPSARRIDRIERSGAQAVVVLKSGESLEFVSDAAGAWRTGIFLAAARTLPGLTALRENLATVRANATVLRGGENGGAPAGSPP